MTITVRLTPRQIDVLLSAIDVYGTEVMERAGTDANGRHAPASRADATTLRVLATAQDRLLTAQARRFTALGARLTAEATG